MSAPGVAVGAIGEGSPPGLDVDRLIAETAALYDGAGRFARGFVRGKLRGDPVTAAVFRHAARSPFGSVADLGCGRGQLGLALLLAGLAERVTGLDLHPGKIADAARAAAAVPARRGAARFAVADLGEAPVPQSDTILLIDLLLQMPEAAQHALLGRIAGAARRRVLIRTFDPGRGWRARLGRGTERLARAARRDGTAFAPMPVPALEAALVEAGFRVSVAPCWGRTPLPNVLVAAERVRPG